MIEKIMELPEKINIKISIRNEINGKIVDKKFSNGRDYLGIEIPKDLLCKKDVRGVLSDNDLCEELSKRYKIED